MKKLYKIDLFISSLVLVIAVIIQGVIFFKHNAEWYRNFYYVLGAIGIGLLLFIGYYLFVMLKGKRFIVSGVVLLCAGLTISVQQYRSAITHIDPTKDISGMNYFVLVPFVICALLSMFAFLFNYLRQRKNNCAAS